MLASKARKGNRRVEKRRVFVEAAATHVVERHACCVHYWQMSQTVTIRLTKELAAWLEQIAKRSGVPRGRFIREQLERARASRSDQSFMRLAGTIRGARDLSKRKGFSRP